MNIKSTVKDIKKQNLVNNIYKKMAKYQLKLWSTIHIKANNANTIEKKEELEQYIIYLGYNFPCSRCRPHIIKYLSEHPIKSYYNIIENNKDIGMAKWSWEFHHNVNVRLNKKVKLTWEQYCKLYNI